MAAGNRIHAKAYRDKMRGVADELRRLVARAGLDMRQKRYLHERMNEYKILHESGVGGGGFQNENSTNSVENSWCPKDTGSALREKTEALAAMQKAADEMSRELQALRAKYKQARILEQSAVDSRVVEGLEGENRDLRRQLADLQREAIDSRLSFQNSMDRYREKSEMLQKALADAKNKSAEQPPSLDMANAICSISDLSAEIARYRERVLGLTADLAASEKVVRNTQDVVSVLERAVRDLESSPRVKLISGERPSEEVENILAEELRNASAAFEQVSKTNRGLEQQVAQLYKKTQFLFSENAHLKNKEKLYEEAKAAIEKERKRFETCRAEVREVKEQLDRQQLMISGGGVSAKLAHYKAAAKNHEQNWIAATHELKNTKDAYQSAAAALERLESSHLQLEQEHRKQERWIATYKALAGEDGQPDAVSDIEMYRKILRCTLCDANLKNCTIVKCMHCFCIDCLQSRIKSRLRTCPACDRDFTMNDVKKIYL